jgi:hypothetical protein
VGLADADGEGESPDDWPGEPEGPALGESHGGMQSTGVDVAPAVGLALEDIEGEGLRLAEGPALSVAEALPVGLAAALGQGTE